MLDSTKLGKPVPKKLKPWSISTTLRNPSRLKDFLSVLRDHFEGKPWTRDAQQEYQIRLIQTRLYGAYNHQFYTGLSTKQKELMEGAEDMNFAEAKAIFESKSYKDPPMRGRTSFKPLQKLGFADIRSKSVVVTKAGEALLDGSMDIGDLIFRSLLKWQLPNVLDSRGFPGKFGYSLKPLISTLHLIREVNRLCEQHDMKPVGISQTELAVYGLTMIRWDDVIVTASRIVESRRGRADLPLWRRDEELLQHGQEAMPEFELKNVMDYADNAVRYFRMSGLFHLRGNGRFIDLEELRRVEIDALLDADSGKPTEYTPAEQYCEVLGNPAAPTLPWETREKMVRVVARLMDEIEKHAGEDAVTRSDLSGRSLEQLKNLVAELRSRRDELLSAKAKSDLEDPKKIRQTIDSLRNLLKGPTRSVQRSIMLESLVAEGLVALNDAMEIRPNYPRGDDGYPRAHAPAGKPDIECYYFNFSLICEVTTRRDKTQWVEESQPVMRHLRAFEQERGDAELVFALFIAPTINRDTINTFWISVKHEYEGRPQRIVPITVEEFCTVLEVCLERREAGSAISRHEIRELLSQIVELSDTVRNSTEWGERIPQAIEQWCKAVRASP